VLRVPSDLSSPLDVSVSASGIAYAALDRTAVRRSSDGGATWQALPALPGVIDVAVGPPPSEIVFAVVSALSGEDAPPAAPRRLRGGLCAAPVPGAEAPATRAGVYRLEAGAWRQALAADLDVVDVHPTDPSVVVALGGS